MEGFQNLAASTCLPQPLTSAVAGQEMACAADASTRAAGSSPRELGRHSWSMSAPVSITPRLLFPMEGQARKS